MSSTRSSGNLLFPPTDPESLLRAASAEKRRQRILANATEPNIHVPSTSHPSTSFHTPATSSPGTPTDLPFTPSLLRTKPMADSINPTNASPSGGDDPSNNTDPPKGTDPPKKTTPLVPKGGSSSSNSVGKNLVADHYVELLLKLQHTAAMQLQEERQHNIDQRRADRERIARLENTLFDVVTKAEEEKQVRLTPTPKSTRLDLQKFRIADGPHYTGPFHDIEPFLKWIRQLQIFFSTKGVVDDIDKIRVTGGLIEDTNLLDFYMSEESTYADKSWEDFRKRLFEVGLPQQWRTTLKTKLRQISMGPTESFIAFSGRGRTLQSLINFEESPSSSPATIRLPDFDLAEFVVLGISEELRGEIIKFALLDVTPFVYSAFEKRVADFDEVTKRKNVQRHQRSAPRAQSPPNNSPDPAAWRVHAYLDSQGQCHHCKSTCGSTYGSCTKPLNKRWVDIPTSFVTPPRPADYQPPKARGPTPNPAGKPTHPPAGRAPNRSASLAAIDDGSTTNTVTGGTDYVDVVDAIDMDSQLFDEATIADSLPPDLTTGDWATIHEIEAILTDNVAGAEEDDVSLCDSAYDSDLGRDPFEDAPSSP
ncbi:hypothetical protein Pst134EB_016157 [Puccinia striiformis f. sp. tritici]|uniref:Retrotransposon gag domain-containing protein n=1 Tax=Puccinia striiformis f. sp. tritici PST-78 TaxID=1165861 RepID=A0A0L0VF93_9BASI|nr:hypothetical protein Pst134EB_016157 [Puccinia striiformis f. sp. tritici]KNE97669.1 hypothetical protein PSTG_09073 [Puccinia striiformis f. sp. tritici PST-78]